MCRNLVNNTRICSKCRGRLYALNNPLGRVVSKLRSRSKRKGIEFDLTVEYLKSLPLIEHYMTQRAENPNQFHIDRIDPLKGYVKGNIRVVEASENLRKAYTDKKVHEWERQRLNGQEEMPWEDQMDEEIECPF